jgi:hypothetical protein
MAAERRPGSRSEIDVAQRLTVCVAHDETVGREFSGPSGEKRRSPFEESAVRRKSELFDLEGNCLVGVAGFAIVSLRH